MMRSLLNGRPMVALFDVDGTLVSGRGAGLAALTQAFTGLYGRPDAFEGIRFHGNTDRGIAREALVAIGVAPTESAIDRSLRAYAEALDDHAERLSGYVAHLGVVELLDALVGREALALGLGTGNIEKGARLKLEAPGLNDYFAFGGFGSDAEDRGELLEVGARRGAAQLGVARSACDVVVIGDTVRDVAAAKAIGATCIAVATGGNTLAELAAAGAERVVTTLEQLVVDP